MVQIKRDWLRNAVIRARNTAQRNEIECAIDDVKRGYGRSKGRLDREAIRRISIVGKVPRGFFEWFEERRGIDWKYRKMLENCFFEDRFGGTAADRPLERCRKSGMSRR